ncbi:MAG TPA: ribonuclease HII [Acidimicrobiales bacterium]|nr:ribonuclease HII [Acidimicrobiales bacterium]
MAKVMTPTLSEERKLRKAGHSWVVGLDEVGRGAWAGPLTVGAALMKCTVSERSMPRWLRDSKQLSEDRRESIFEEVGHWCAEWSVGHATPEECDAWGMTIALRLAAERALAGLTQQPEALIIDGPINLLRIDADDPGSFTGPVRTIPGGDARCASVAAASVLAKVVRDRLMRQEADHFPAYAFERNKGYPSPVHQLALRGYGLSTIHRRSWSYVEGLPWRDKWPIVRKTVADQV